MEDNIIKGYGALKHEETVFASGFIEVDLNELILSIHMFPPPIEEGRIIVLEHELEHIDIEVLTRGFNARTFNNMGTMHPRLKTHSFAEPMSWSFGQIIHGKHPLPSKFNRMDVRLQRLAETHRKPATFYLRSARLEIRSDRCSFYFPEGAVLSDCIAMSESLHSFLGIVSGERLRFFALNLYDSDGWFVLNAFGFAPLKQEVRTIMGINLSAAMPFFPRFLEVERRAHKNVDFRETLSRLTMQNKIDCSQEGRESLNNP